jgi:LmbE family N-acetylglucosaminyl deacetylase
MAEVKAVAVVVAHPDDETLWAGGTLLMHQDWSVFIISLCRGSDPDRAPRYVQALEALQAKGRIGDLDDGPSQDPLPQAEVKKAILDLLPAGSFDLLFTHSPRGEYTRHLRHEETAGAVVSLWTEGRIRAKELRMFAYGDAGRRHLPQPFPEADVYTLLPSAIWQKKYGMITGIYGFAPDSWEARTVPRAEAFWQFTDAAGAQLWPQKIPA